MNVLYVWDADYPWDVRAAKICTALTCEGHQVHIAARNRGWQPRLEVRPEGTVHRMHPWRLLGRRLDGVLSFPAFPNPRWIAHLARTTATVNPDVIVVRDLPLCPTAIWVARRYRVPVVLDMAENYPAMIQEMWDARRHRAMDLLVRNPRLAAVVERYCLRRVDKILVVVEESRERVVRLGVPVHRVAIVSNTPPRERAMRPRNQKLNGHDSPLALVYLGLMEIPRGVGDLIDAVARLRDAGRSVSLRLIGDGRDREHFEQQAAALRLSEPEVEFLGHVPNEIALRMVAEADVGVVPHHADEAWNTTIPNKLFDYMAAGLPVVSSDAVPAARVVAETGAGEVFRSRDPEDLAAAVTRLFNRSTRARLGAAGQRAIMERYHWERDAARLLAAVEEIAMPTDGGRRRALLHSARRKAERHGVC